MNNNLKECFIKLPNDWYDNLDITNEEITLLILLYRNYMLYKSIAVCSLESLASSMYINTNSNKKIISIIKDTISYLIEKEYITGLYGLHYQEISLDDITNKNQIFYVELIEPPETNYFMVKDIDIDNIFNHLQGVNIDKFSIIRYFVACRRVVNTENKFGYLTQGKLKQLVNHSKTIQGYNKILQDDLKLIRYNNNYLTKEKHYCTTFIGLYNEKESFDKMVECEVENKGLVRTDKIKSNKKRKLKQQANDINSKINDPVNMDKIKELEAQLEAKNKQLEALQYKNEKEQREKEDKEICDLVTELNLQIQNDEELDEDETTKDIPGILKVINQLQKEKEDDNIDPWESEEVESDCNILESNDYDIGSLIEFLPKDSSYLDYVETIAEHKMTVKEFFKDIYPDATYNAFLKFRELKDKKKINEINISEIGIGDDNWGDTEDYDTNDLQDYLGDNYNKYSHLVEKIENRELSLQEFFDKHYSFRTYDDFKEFQEQPF